ncbi:hypothetical protein [Escherichia coli]|uniref:hypothetical protein n=1 Tax=Escherichia coli TaxID=562 RepID=UPI0020D0431E|nr:hypothetical protein [Escherichia coli]MCP8792590.1 hypothetical protein [Escherichia coli]
MTKSVIQVLSVLPDVRRKTINKCFFLAQLYLRFNPVTLTSNPGLQAVTGAVELPEDNRVFTASEIPEGMEISLLTSGRKPILIISVKAVAGGTGQITPGAFWYRFHHRWCTSYSVISGRGGGKTIQGSVRI